jgi:Asp-tRNA(Asn)/Glu-tRNA(Gln) amidotransferase A subunit family amidase
MMGLRGWTHEQANKAIRDLRAWLGEYDSVSLPCDPQGQGDRWLYRLTGDLSEVEAWSANRMRDADSRLRTMQAMLASIVSGTSGRTRDGYRARLMERQLRRLVEDLDGLVIDPTKTPVTTPLPPPRPPRSSTTP